MELWFQYYGNVMLTLGYTFELVAQPSENFHVAENHYYKVTTHLKVNTFFDSMFLQSFNTLQAFERL